MMRAKAKDWLSPDVPEVWKWQPQLLDDVYYFLEMTIGSEDSPGGDLFGLRVVSPQASCTHSSRSRANRRWLFVTEYSWQVVLDHVDNVLTSARRKPGPGVARRLSQYFYWEYEGIKSEAEEAGRWTVTARHRRLLHPPLPTGAKLRNGLRGRRRRAPPATARRGLSQCLL